VMWSVLWVALALLFNGYIWAMKGANPALEFLTAYLIEKALSVDNLFVFLAIFSYFKCPEHLQPRVLLWGVLGAMGMRLAFILAGTALLAAFTWMIYVFGAFLIWTGAKLAFSGEAQVDPEKSLPLRLAHRFLRIRPEFEDKQFFVRFEGRLYATLLFLVLLVIEFTDVLFAVDSVPAVLAITPDFFLAYTSNIFAIMGLRALYFVLAGMMGRFRYLGKGLAAVLVFIGAKMAVSGFLHVPTGLSLGVVAGILTLSVVLSLVIPESLVKPPSSN